MSDTPKLDFNERQRTQQVYEECCENPEDFAYKYVELQSEFAVALAEIKQLKELVADVAANKYGPAHGYTMLDFVKLWWEQELDRNRKAEKRIAELTPDAERYRWLCYSPNSWWHTWNPDAPPGLKQRVDNEIDAARAKENA